MTLDEIAKLAGVSKTTASYVINGKAQQYRISAKTQQKVMAVVSDHNYQPDRAASSLRAGHTRSFGLIIPDLENSSYAKLAKLLESNSRQAGYQILIGCSDDDNEREKEVAQALVSRRIDALLVASTMPEASDFYLAIQKLGTPVIAIDRPLDDEFFACVVSEDNQGAYQLTQSILSPSIKTVGLIGALPELTISKERHLGVEKAVRQAGKQLQVAYGQHFDRREGSALFSQWLMQGTLPDALITTSYTLLEGVLDVLVDHSAISQQLPIATFGDNRLLDFLPFKINSLSQQFELIADSATELAINASAKRYHTGVEFIARQLICRR